MLMDRPDAAAKEVASAGQSCRAVQASFAGCAVVLQLCVVVLLSCAVRLQWAPLGLSAVRVRDKGGLVRKGSIGPMCSLCHGLFGVSSAKIRIHTWRKRALLL